MHSSLSTAGQTICKESHDKTQRKKDVSRRNVINVIFYVSITFLHYVNVSFYYKKTFIENYNTNFEKQFWKTETIEMN